MLFCISGIFSYDNYNTANEGTNTAFTIHSNKNSQKILTLLNKIKCLFVKSILRHEKEPMLESMCLNHNIANLNYNIIFIYTTEQRC